MPGTAKRLKVVAGGDAGDIATLGEYDLNSDAAHPDEAGYRLFAETLVPQVLPIAASHAQVGAE